LAAWHQAPASAPGSEGRLAGEASLEVSEGEEDHQQRHRALLCTATHKPRRRTSQKKIWRSIESAKDAAGYPRREMVTKFKDMVHQDLARKYEESKRQTSASAYTPVKNLIYTPAKHPACTDLNAATLLFASQMKLTLSG